MGFLSNKIWVRIFLGHPVFTLLYVFFSKYLISQIFLLTYITTFEPETPAVHPKNQKTRIVAQYPVKTSAKYYHLTIGVQGQAKWAKVAQKSSTYDITRNKPASPKQTIFFKCRLEDLPHLLRLIPGLQSIPDRRNSHTKPHAFRRFFSENPRNQPDAKELR